MSTPIQIRTRDDEKNYDFSPYPTSWIQIGWSHELRRGQVRAVRCLGRELVLFRGEDGRVRVVDAYCPHLGAHLGVGGSVGFGALAGRRTTRRWAHASSPASRAVAAHSAARTSSSSAADATGAGTPSTK